MNSLTRLGDYPFTPLYNIKAVVQATGISSSTLRAWERRYQVCQPQRTESGYRLYSDRDIAIIRWLKQQVEAGMAISQAVSWLDNLAEEAQGLEHVALPGNHPPPAEHNRFVEKRQFSVRDIMVLQNELLAALVNFDENQAEHLMTEAFSLYPLEFIGENLVAPLLVEVGERWHKGTLSITREHYITSYLTQRLAVLLRSVQNPNKGAQLWVACASTEQHDIGAILLTLYLRRAGYQVHFMGKDLPRTDFVQEVRLQRPALVLLSASTAEGAQELRELTAALAQIENQRPIIGYGGRIFKNQLELRKQITGIYMGDSAVEAVESTNELLLNNQSRT